jgi:hypothetical protein
MRSARAFSSDGAGAVVDHLRLALFDVAAAVVASFGTASPPIR